MNWREEVNDWHAKCQAITEKAAVPVGIIDELTKLYDLIDVVLKMLLAKDWTGENTTKQAANCLYFFALPQIKKIQMEIKNAI